MASAAFPSCSGIERTPCGTIKGVRGTAQPPKKYGVGYPIQYPKDVARSAMQGQWHPLTALWIRGHTPAMLQRFIDYQRQPRQLLTLPARLVAFSAAAYILLTVTTGEREHIAL